MRKQQRPAEPDVLRAHGVGWNTQWANLRARNSEAKFSWYKHEGISARDWVLEHLKEMTQGHCAFCDAFPLDDKTREPIEHFKPKTDPRFLLEAYAWTNLYYCCDFCQGRKGDKWDDKLLRPDEKEYEFDKFFYFEFTTGEIKPVGGPEGERARVTINMYGLDKPAKRRARKFELRRWQRSHPRDLDDFAYRDFIEPKVAATD